MRTELASSSPRFPFGIPRGWFVVAFSSELPAGSVSTLRYFGRELVAYRGASGQAYLKDAYCPHLGAHLGHGGTVEGETVRCPFHGWRFDGEGRCAEVPGSKITPEKARIRAYPVREQNGVIFAFYDPEERTPWALPVLDEEGWTEGKTIHWRGLRTHAREVFENTVDTAHIGPVHDGRGARLVKKPERDGERLTIDIAFTAPGDIVGMPGTLNDVSLVVSMIGLGVVVVNTHVTNAGVRARQRIYVTPIDEDSVDIRGIVHVEKQADPVFTEELATIFHRAYVDDFAKDFPIWENKRYLETPLLSPVDGPVGLYRRWCEQFHVATPASAAPRREAFEVPSWALLKRTVEERVLGPARSKLASLRPASSASSEAASQRESNASSEHAPTTSPEKPSGRRVGSAEEYFQTLPERFVPAAARGVNAVFQWELGDETFHARVNDGALEVAKGPHDRPTVALVIPAEAYVRVVNGDLDGTWAFSSGLGRVKGSLSAAMKMRALFPAA